MNSFFLKLLLYVLCFLPFYTFSNCTNTIDIKKDDFANKIMIRSDRCRTETSNTDSHTYSLISTRKDAFFMSLAVTYDDKEWRYYTHALDANGNEYKAPVTRKVYECGKHRICTYIESIAFPIDKKILELIAEKGLDVRFETSLDQFKKINNISAPMAKAFLEKYNEIYKD